MPTMNVDQLVTCGIQAMKKAQDVKVNENNIDVLIVGNGQETKLLKEEEIRKYLEEIEGRMEVN